MEKNSLFREYFPGYMGHIPYKYEVIGMTVGATNSHIKSLLRKEPDYEKTFVPSIKNDIGKTKILSPYFSFGIIPELLSVVIAIFINTPMLIYYKKI